MRLAHFSGLMLILMPSAAAAQDLSWMAGYWLSCGDGREVSETWTDTRGSVMLGISFTLRRDRPSWEFSRIGPSGSGISFFAQPHNQPAAEFRAVEFGENRVVFENPQHDFPQRVIYRREGNRLHGRIEGVAGGRAQSADWQYEAASLNARCPATAAPSR